MHRTHEVEAVSTIGVSTSVGVEIEHGSSSWQNRWRTFVHHHGELRAIYAGTANGNNIGWEQTVRALLGDAFQFRDHISADLGLTKDVGDWVDSQPNLSLARTFANTDKYYEGANSAHRMVYIKGTSSGPEGNAVILRLETPRSLLANVDSLDVPTGCLTEWRRFLTNYGLAEPG